MSLELCKQAQQAYVNLLGTESLTVDELGQRLDIGLHQLHEHLAQLVAISLVTWDRESGAVQAISPQLGFAGVVASAEAEAARQNHEAENAKAALASLSAEYEASRDRESLVSLSSASAVRARLEELALGAEAECISLNPGRVRPPGVHESSKPLNEQALERGVTIKSIYQASFRHESSTLEYARWLTSKGGLIRTVPVVPFLMIVVDRRVALVPQEIGRPEAGAFEVRAPSLVAGLSTLFDLMWDQAELIDSVVTDRPSKSPTSLEAEIVHLLASGNTDEFVARKLELSVRTVRRLMATVMAQLGARSRFEAGVECMRRGWLT